MCVFGGRGLHRKCDDIAFNVHIFVYFVFFLSLSLSKNDSMFPAGVFAAAPPSCVSLFACDYVIIEITPHQPEKNDDAVLDGLDDGGVVSRQWFYSAQLM